MKLSSNVTQDMILEVQKALYIKQDDEGFRHMVRSTLMKALFLYGTVTILGVVLFLVGSESWMALLSVGTIGLVGVVLLNHFNLLSGLSWMLNRRSFAKQIYRTNGGMASVERTYDFLDTEIVVTTHVSSSVLLLKDVDKIDVLDLCDVYYIKGNPEGMVFKNFDEEDLRIYNLYKETVLNRYKIVENVL